jgi:hypothetical protein
MDSLTLLSKLLEFGAWPLAAIAIILVLRKEIQALLQNVKKFKAGPLEVELERVVKELEATKKVAAAAEATAQVVAAKLDEGEDKTDLPRATLSSEAKPAPPVSEIELKVLKTMVESKFVTRSVSGVAKDANLSKAVVQATYGALIGKGMIEQVENAEGNLRWRVSALGRVVANEA